MKHLFSIIICIATTSLVFAQNFDYAYDVIEELSDTSYYGRGYYNQGDYKAARYIANEYKTHGLNQWEASYFQSFSFPVNVFQNDMDLIIDNKPLKPGYDFVVRSFSAGAEGEFSIFEIDSTKYDEAKCIEQLAKLDSVSDAIVCNFNFARKNKALYKAIYKSPAQVIILSWDDPLKFYKAHAGIFYTKCIIWTQSESMPEDCKSVNVDIDRHYNKEHITQNVIGYLPAEQENAEWLLFIAHYDHLGMLGEHLFFPGSNDNASGVSMLLSFAEAYKNQKRKYNMAFVAVAGEECGLLGSKHYVENPYFPLEDIKLVINLDMVADNGDSLYVQHSEAANLDLKQMEEIALKQSSFKGFEHAELSPHSDHFPFAEKEIPVVFFSTHGDYNAHYHTPLDDMEHISMSGFKDLFKIIKAYIDA